MKTIKRERQVRLDELLKYVWDNEITSTKFNGSGKYNIYVDSAGEIDVDAISYIAETDLFTITEEVDITEDTVIDLAYRIETEKGWKTFDKHGVTINKIIDTYKKHINVYLGFIYLLNDDCGIGDLIWTKERGLID